MYELPAFAKQIVGMENEKPKLEHVPKDYEISDKQEFDFPSAEKFLIEYCKNCIKGRECEMRYGLRDALGNNYPFWDTNFIALEPKKDYMNHTINEDLERKVICRKFEFEQLNLNRGMK